VRVEDAQGQPPGIPFWLGEAPGRTAELSRSVSRLRLDAEQRLETVLEQNKATGSQSAQTDTRQDLAEWIATETGLTDSGAAQLADYFSATFRALGVIPSQQKLVLERFFDESGGMQLVIHSPFGIRLNRAWGLALRKRFCRSFTLNYKLPPLTTRLCSPLEPSTRSPLADVFHYLNSRTVREILIQALLDAPMFGIRWRWNATRALALPRQRGGHKVPAPLQRMESENLLAAIFPDQLACLENIAGDREIPENPLVQQTIDDCLTEAMDIDGLTDLLNRIESGEVECIARDLPEPSPLAHEILNAKPYAFLDNAPLEERRTQAVYTRRAGESSADTGLGILDAAAIEKVCVEAWPRATNADELHETLLLMGVIDDEEVRQLGEGNNVSTWPRFAESERRTGKLATPHSFWVAAERLPMLQAVYPGCDVEPGLTAPPTERERDWPRAIAVRELVRGRMEVIGPITAKHLVKFFQLSQQEIEGALLALEAEGFVLRGKFHPAAQEIEWCDRRLLARIHRLTINRLRAEIQPVSIAEFQRFLLAWQRADEEHRVEGLDGVRAVLESLDGYELPAAAWEPEVLALRIKDYTPAWLDQLCFHRTASVGDDSLRRRIRMAGPCYQFVEPGIIVHLGSTLLTWCALAADSEPVGFSPDTQHTLETLSRRGALFFRRTGEKSDLLPRELSGL